MGNAEPTQVIYWTRFPTQSLPATNWEDHKQAHKAIMRLFAQNLPGQSETKRAQSHVLYRVDQTPNGPLVIVQSTIQPELLPHEAASFPVPATAWEFKTGDTIAFRLAVNPVKRTGKHKPSHPKSETPRTVPSERTVPFDETPEWLANKLSEVLAEINIYNHYRDTTKSGPQKLTLDTIEGTATIINTDAFNTIRLEGIGRAKSYGAGLITAQPTN